MLRVSVFTDGGLVLWSRDSAQIPAEEVNAAVVRSLIDESQPSLKDKRQFSARVHHLSGLGVSTVVVWPSLLHVREADTVASDLAKIFEKVNGDAVAENKKLGEPLDTGLDIDKFAALAQVRLEQVANELVNQESNQPTELPTEPEVEKQAEVVAETPTTVKKALKKRGGKKKNAAATVTPEPEEAKKKSKKKMRNWDGYSDDDDDAPGQLDYSTTSGEPNVVPALDKLSLDDYGSRSNKGFLVKELDSILSEPTAAASKESFGFLKGLTGGKKLTDADLNKALDAMEDHLVRKNVAKEVAVDICGEVRSDLVGTSTQSWTSVKSTVKASVTRQLRKILTPSTSTDLLIDIKTASKKSPRPYVISVVGVNGVGKSTNLGKLAFWLLQNDFRVLIAACDTFRSGAVEQLKVHVDRLRQLTEREGHGHVELFDQGYGKDAAVIAKKAVEHGQKHHYDIVLIDTAGRRHNDERLMSSLEKFGNLAQPNKIVMVGEALVGTDSVEQARNFDAAFGPHRQLDFFLVSKCDTVGDMLGTLVNITYTTGVPVLFVGVGQQYTDLRTLSVEWAVNLLLE